ncbi:ABC-type glutathione transport system ATPase component [Brevibacterium paucivorans]|uniref:ABC-type glutathione transport system ATPase component n=1 Tax=Brevibacterium paucivorans TaxID=170994 RepID=A0ABS2SIP3_9MICO|nr:ABC transporter ATP-binding protein [Brevibacterium paucivorans]MBM7815854.1 ABC-type glutathione transport system ATPase component [Brevibacterium paucivorans]
MSELLHVKDLRIATETTELVKPLSFDLASGERVGLIGESGSGKSLTASAIMGLLPDELQSSGTIELQGHAGNLLTLSDARMSKLRGKDISMVFQEPMSALNPLMRVGDQVAEVMKLHGNTANLRDKVIELLTRVDLPDPQAAAKAYPHQLSGGQRQRVVIAIAMANSPRLLICDEPTTALDVTVQSGILDLIGHSVQKNNTGLLFITHDLAVVARVCEHVLVMYKGELVERGTVKDVFTNPQHEYTRGLLAASDLSATDDNGRLFTIQTAQNYRLEETAREEAGDDVAVTEGSKTGDNSNAQGSTKVGDTSAGEKPRIVVEVRDLKKDYERKSGRLFARPHKVHALNGIDLTIQSGQRFGIVGESGSGKSTLLKILSGLETASSGKVTVGDYDVTAGAEADIRKVREDLQIVFQDPFASLDPRMKVREIVAEPLIAMGVPAQERATRVREMLLAVGLDETAENRYPHQFSGGQRQRISIARALVCRPQILVADEPVSALDVSVRAQVLNLLTDLVEEYGLTLIFVSHDLSVVRYLCSDVAVMKSGEIVETGTVDQIYDAPAHPYTQSLVAATPQLEDALAHHA